MKLLRSFARQTGLSLLVIPSRVIENKEKDKLKRQHLLRIDDFKSLIFSQITGSAMTRSCDKASARSFSKESLMVRFVLIALWSRLSLEEDVSEKDALKKDGIFTGTINFLYFLRKQDRIC